MAVISRRSIERPFWSVGLAGILGLIALCSNSQLPAEESGANPSPRWWKGNLHTHTFWSDGNDFPDMVAAWYREHDYNFLALSDHNLLSQGIRWDKESKLTKKGGADVVSKYLAKFGPAWVERRGEGADVEVRLKPLEEFRCLVEERGKFLMIPSEEISDKAEGVPIHINAANLKEAMQPLGGATVTEAITNNLRAVHDQAERAGREILAHLNHPNYHYAVTAHDLAHAVLEKHFEIHNGHPGVNQKGDHHHPSMEKVWDIANTIRLVELKAPPLYGVATDDSHDYHGKPGSSHPGRGWVMVRATHLTPEHIVKALKAGDSYSSTGVTLRDIRYDAVSKTLRVEIEPEAGATYSVQFVGSLKGRGNGRHADRYVEAFAGGNQGARSAQAQVLRQDRRSAEDRRRPDGRIHARRQRTLCSGRGDVELAAGRPLVGRSEAASLDATDRLEIAAGREVAETDRRLNVRSCRRPLSQGT
jgi:predicted metal-dependent phosphoesterase TrpH